MWYWPVCWTRCSISVKYSVWWWCDWYDTSSIAAGLRPDPLVSLSAPPDPLAVLGVGWDLQWERKGKERMGWHRRNVPVPVPVPPLFGLGVPYPPLFRTQVKNLLSSEAICRDQITLKPFSAGAPLRTPSPESSCLVSSRKYRRSLREGLQG